ncbi:P-loop containing nucleoside triphosphate hydrolase protein [Neocallimastix lanati (nom. inval.)]|nr:P-loop containing nucleoside triphosphate hydrolase protein [Neocallimastix sp. JGI-2020a]
MNKKSKRENKKEKKEEKVITFSGEKIENVSFSNLFKYANGKEKLMIFLGIINSIIQGCVLPTVIFCLGNMLDSFISLVINLAVKKITGINDENILKEIMDSFNSDNLANVERLQKTYPKINFDNLINSFKQSSYSGYNFSSSSNSFQFRKEEEIFNELNKIFIVIGIVSLISFLATYIYYSFLDISALRVTSKIRSLVFKSILKQDISWHEKTNAGELSSRIISDTLLIEDGIGFKMGMIFQNITTFICGLLLAFITNWKLSLYMSGTFIVITSVVGIMGGVLAKCTKKVQDSYGISGGIAQETFSQIRTVVSFGNEQKESERYTQSLISSLKLGIKKSHMLGISMGLFFCVTYLCYSVAFIKGGQFVNNGEITAGDVLKVLMGVVFGSLSIGACGTSFNAIASASGAAAFLYYVIQRKPCDNHNEYTKDNVNIKGNDDSIKSDNNNKVNVSIIKEMDNHQPLIKGHIEFRNVHFTYPSRPDAEVLKGISFKCHPGQTIALVGASGSGKSTIIQLLERFYEKSDGEILIDGKKIEDYSTPWLRSQMGLVSQEPALFNTSIAENISISCPEKTSKEIEEAAKLANAHEFISKLSHGYQTLTGEKGLQLSGGQKQRICIARALIMNPKILLLDEATSALDNQSEKLVQAALDSVSKGRTTIVIAHRLSTVRNADCIIVMDKGTIVESGTHNELMAEKNIYYHLVKSQTLTINETEEEEITNSYKEENLFNSNLTENEEETQLEEEIKEEIEDENENENYIITSNDELLNKKIISSNNEKPLDENENGNKNVHNKKKKTFSMDWRRYIQYNKPVMGKNIIGIIGCLFNGCMQPLTAFIYACAMSAFNKQGQDLLDSTKFWGLMFVLLAVGNFITAYSKNYGLSAAGEYLLFTFRKEMYGSMIKQEIGYFDTGDMDNKNEANTKSDGNGNNNNANSSALTAKLSTETTLVQGFNINFGTIVEIFTGIIVCCIIAFCYGWKLSLVLLIFTPFLFVGIYIQARSMVDRNEEKRKIFEKSTKVVVESITAIKTVYALNLQDHFGKLYDEQLVEPQRRLEHQYKKSSFGIGFGNCMTNLAYGVGFYFGYIFLKSGDISFEDMFKIVMAIIFTSGNVGQASIAIPDLVKSGNAFGRILQTVNRKSKIDASSSEGCKKNKLNGEISFNHLRFHYPSRPDITVLRLRENKIHVPEGKTLALVGGSGCGKSTLIGLLLRWYDAEKGEILVDGQKNIDYNLKWLRGQMGIVSQEPCLFNISIKENIRYGKQNATDEEIKEAAKKANIHEFIESLPEGYDTMVGGEGTTQMSGGQKQRVAIARAIIRNPKVLLLDEATSALDAESELLVQSALEKASQNCTIITIAHRLSTIRNADMIIVMNKGKIVEQGSHEELLAKKGNYYEMVVAGESEYNPYMK